MDGFEEMLSSILSSPKDMEKIMGLARELSGASGGEENSGHQEAAFDPKLLSLAAKLIGEVNGGQDDEKQALISALCPFVREERREALRRALKVAKLARAARAILSDPAMREAADALL